VAILAFLGGLTNVVDMPTRQAFAVEMVGREDIGNAVALNSAMFNSARILGPAVAGLTIGAFDISIAFFVDAISFLAVLIALVAMRESELRPAPPMARPTSAGEVLTGLREGLSYVRRTPLVLVAVAVIGLVSTFGMNFPVIIPPFTEQVLHSDATGYGFLMAASGLGSLVAALYIAFSPRSRTMLIAGGAILVGVAEIALATAHLFSVSLLLMFLVGLGAIAMAATANTTIQLAVPDRLRGRTMAVYTTVFAGSTPIGGLLMGWIASRYGVAESLAAGGIACAAIGLAAFAWLRRARADALVEAKARQAAGAGTAPAAARPR
jgi:predicted MFS family arabinose efflux permease